jgi:hypothetical protein
LTLIENLLPTTISRTTNVEFASEGVSDYRENHTNRAAVSSDVILRQVDGLFLL